MAHAASVEQLVDDLACVVTVILVDLPRHKVARLDFDPQPVLRISTRASEAAMRWALADASRAVLFGPRHAQQARAARHLRAVS